MRRSVWVIPILGIMTGTGALSLDMYLPAFPAIAADYGVTEGEVQITLSTFLFGFAVGQAIYGPLSDALGRRPVVLAALALYGVSSALCALATTVDQLALIRIVQALAGAAGSVLGRAVVRDMFQGPELARAMSTLMLVLTAAPMSAPLIGAAVLEFFGWRAIFWSLAIYAVVWIGLILLIIPETHAKDNRMQLSPGTVWRAYRSVIGSRSAMGYTLTAALGFGGMFASLTATPFLYVELYGVSPGQYALLFALNIVGMAVAAAVNRRFAATHDHHYLMRWTTRIMVGSAAILLFTAISGVGGLVGLVVPLVVFVGSLSAAAANGLSGTMAPFDAIAGSASSVFGTFQFGMGALFGWLTAVFHDGSALPMAALIALGAGAAFILFRLMADTPPVDQSPHSVEAKGS